MTTISTSPHKRVLVFIGTRKGAFIFRRIEALHGALIKTYTTIRTDLSKIYLGTSTGQLFYSRNNGDDWELLADFLPPILSVDVAVIDA